MPPWAARGGVVSTDDRFDVITNTVILA